MKSDSRNIAPETIDYILKVIKTAELVKINNIIIEPGRVRAIDDNKRAIIFHDKDIPDMEFGAIGLNRIDVFSSRFDLARSMTNLDVTASVEETEAGTFARSLQMKGKGIKIEYRCANPRTINAPKTFGNDGLFYKAHMTAEALQIMQKGQTAMSATEVTFVGTPEGLMLEMSDINSDVLSYQISSELVHVTSGKQDANFRHRHDIKLLLPLFRQNPESSFYFTTRGLIRTTVNGLDVNLMPILEQ